MQKSRYEELQTQIANLQQEAEAIFQQEKAQAISRIKEEIDGYGITVIDLGFRPGSSASGARVMAATSAKYRNPATGAEWSGRGPTPQMAQGADGCGEKQGALPYQLVA
ncbi:H-NS histone family protein [Pandoraea apista]|uniref:H-NS histone family protein n=1 Tax=Pandoraea apista TaxID=93218 RepID=UPI000F65B843|nr:H-NS histone family protein [Pandoraea apista]RRW94306.1 H-NS histone family protein [Pandoraea apista]RRX00665.1 H-NS histone family protein [Pandoraea apista]